MRKLSFLVLLFVAAACSTESYDDGSVSQGNVSKKIEPAMIGASGASNISSAISQLKISGESQSLLLSSIDGIVRLKQEGATYEVVHALMVDFENKVMASTISNEEKEILLSSFSIAQYDIYASTEEDGGGRKDRDWELLVANFIVTTSTPESSSDAVVNAEVSEITK